VCKFLKNFYLLLVVFVLIKIKATVLNFIYYFDIECDDFISVNHHQASETLMFSTFVIHILKEMLLNVLSKTSTRTVFVPSFVWQLELDPDAN